MNDGAMRPYGLTLDKLLDHAAKWHSETQAVTAGRAKDLIKPGGEWINPAQIEAIVSGLPEVSLAAVVGRSDPKWGERPILLVEMRKNEELTDQQLLEPPQGRVASWWIPYEVVRLPKMPTAAAGKVDKLRLRSQYSRT